MEIKDFSLKLKSIQDGGEFIALAAVYGVEDLQGDVIEKGAFTRAIDQQPAAGYPLLWSHRQDVPIGLAMLTDSERGPIVNGTIDRTDPEGEIAYQRAKKGVVRGVSIGFTIPNPAAVKYKGTTRHISELKLHELSLVAIPAQEGAQILSVKTLGDAARVLDGFPIERLGASEFEALRSIEAHVKRLLATDKAAAPAGPDPSILADLRDLAKLVRVN
jgi:HK97 family phage prohead protease